MDAEALGNITLSMQSVNYILGHPLDFFQLAVTMADGFTRLIHYFPSSSPLV
jgi:hypothetical protein